MRSTISRSVSGNGRERVQKEYRYLKQPLVLPSPKTETGSGGGGELSPVSRRPAGASFELTLFTTAFGLKNNSSL